jgi:hypothetical protein
VIDLSNIRAPGWQRIIAELTAPAAEDRVFLVRLLGVLGQVAGARQAILWAVPRGRDEGPQGPEPMPVMMWPFAASGAGSASLDPMAARVDEAAIDHASDVRSAARSAASGGQARAFGLDARDQMYDSTASAGYVLALPINATAGPEGAGGMGGGGGGGGGALGIVTLVLDARSKQALQTTMALVEVLTGYAHAHATAQQLRRARSSAASLELATRLIASVNSTGGSGGAVAAAAARGRSRAAREHSSAWASGFKACALQLVNDLCRQLAVDRVALGWVRGAGGPRGPDAMGREQRRDVRIVALSDTEQLDRRMAMVQKIEAAMDECLDQEQTILYPPPPVDGPVGDAVLSQAVTHAHRELCAADARVRAASFPLRVPTPHGDTIVGVVLIETGVDTTQAEAAPNAPRLDVGVVELVQAALDLVAPVLAVRHSDDRALALRAWDWSLKVAAWAVGPTHTVWKAAGILLMVATLVVTFVKIPYRVGAPVELRAKERRVVSAPFDGTIASVEANAAPGSAVRDSEVLVRLDATSRALGALEARAQMGQYDAEADEALRKGDNAAAEQARKRAEQSRARLDLLEYEVDRAAVRAPIDGTVIQGDLSDRIGAAVKTGDVLLEVADLSAMRLVARVEDRDIAFISPGQAGEFSPKSDPSREYAFVVERIVPLSQATEGQNAFEVHALLAVPGTGALRPGMEGQARFTSERRSLAWIGSRRVLDQLRLWLWW